MEEIRKAQEKIYLELYKKHKGTPMMVSSESKEHKKIRFENISRIFNNDSNFTLHDIGLGMADFYQYLLEYHQEKVYKYSGSDILFEFCDEAKNRFPEITVYHRDISEKPADENYDYLIMSGLFHQRQETKIKDWEAFSQKIIYNSFVMCNKGIAFNFISPFVDFYQTQVYYCNLSKLLNFVNDKLSRFFVINHDYALFEFTMFVYKEDYIKKKFPQNAFSKYFFRDEKK